MNYIIKCEGKTDEELVPLVLENQSYFLCLMEKYESKLLRYIMRISGVRYEDAEDILQEVFIKVYENLYGFDSDLKFSSWIYRIAHNHVISEFRKKRNRMEIILSEEEDWHNFVSDLNIAHEVDAKLSQEVINKVLNNLDIKYREVLFLKFLEERDYKEISDILKKPMGTVATLINRAKEKFKKELVKQNIKID
ncbi:MAG: RNA polymerase sigma factor [Candidatus Magasanikiibacteriota bacterium]